MRRLFVLGVMALLAGTAEAQARPNPEFITATGGPERPFSPAVRLGNLLFVSGQIGTDSSGKVVAGGIRAETRQTLTNIKAIVERAGSSMDRVVKCTVFMADMQEWSTMNDIYVTFFPNHRPARSAMGANGLALNAKVEIECIAAM
jgi:2-iminobutanoate/2-iminopropanoate deaminase